jgi:hypothetical protein
MPPSKEWLDYLLDRISAAGEYVGKRLIFALRCTRMNLFWTNITAAPASCQVHVSEPGTVCNCYV